MTTSNLESSSHKNIQNPEWRFSNVGCIAPEQVNLSSCNFDDYNSQNSVFYIPEKLTKGIIQL